MNPNPNMREQNTPDTRTGQTELMPRWAKYLLVVFALLVMLGYTSPDMRAVYQAAWSACF